MTPEELKILYHKYYKDVFYHTYNIIRDEEASQDITQDVFINAYSAIIPFSDKRFYLLKMATNKCFDYFRHIKRHRYIEITTRVEENLPEDISKERIIEPSTISKISSIVESLPFYCRNIFKMYWNGFSTSEIMLKMEISERNSLNQKSKAIRVIKNKLCL